MNSKFLLQFIVYLLFGVIAMADPDVPSQVHTGDFIVNDIGTCVKSFIVDNDDHVVYAYKHLNKKQSILKIRFRAESSFRKDHPDSSKLVNAAFPSTVTATQTRKVTHITPFYYVFLFRLTPF